VHSVIVQIKGNDMRYFFVLATAFFSLHSLSQDKIPSKSEFDSIMMNAVKQMNSQMSGVKIDDYTTLKFVTYDLNPPLFSYFYSTSALAALKQSSLNKVQIDAMKKFNINKTCSSNFKPLMKPYNFKVSHVFEDSNSGKILHKLTVSHLDC
jgi:hypothetical protein